MKCILAADRIKQWRWPLAGSECLPAVAGGEYGGDVPALSLILFDDQVENAVSLGLGEMKGYEYSMSWVLERHYLHSVFRGLCQAAAGAREQVSSPLFPHFLSTAQAQLWLLSGSQLACFLLISRLVVGCLEVHV